MKYVIVPILRPAMELEAKDEEDALATFAVAMDSDMHTFFKAEPAETYEGVLQEATRLHYLEWAEDVIAEDFPEIPDEDIKDVAEDAWDRYTDEQGSEYQCIELACESHEKEKQR